MRLPGVVQRSVLINEKAKRMIYSDESGLCYTMDLSGNRSNSAKEKIFLSDENLIPSDEEEILFFYKGASGQINRVGANGKVYSSI